jgi:hypothetical protein
LLFLSYSRNDEAFALRLADDLKKANVPLWMDKMDIRAGQQWDVEVEAALRRSTGLVVILSPDSVASRPVMDEVSFALQEDKLVVPVIAYECEIPFRLRRFQYVSFVDGYEAVIGRLIDELRGSTQPAPAPPAPHPPSPLRPPMARIGFILRAAVAGATFTGLASYLLFVRDPRFIGPQVPGHLRDAVLPYVLIGAVVWGAIGAVAAGIPRAMRWSVATAAVVMILWGLFLEHYTDVTITGIAMGGPMAGLLTAAILRVRVRRGTRPRAVNGKQDL